VPASQGAPSSDAAALRAIRHAFDRREYSEAERQARALLREQPESREAQRLLEEAQAGRAAESRLRSAQSALERGDTAGARREADAARSLAPWDSRVEGVLSRVREIEERSRRESDERVRTILAAAEKALAGHDYDRATEGFDEVLRLEPENRVALLGRNTAINARISAEAVGRALRTPAARSLVPGQTRRDSDELRKADQDVPGFRAAPGIAVSRDTQAADLPADVQFEVEPTAVTPGDRYVIRILLANPGSVPIDVADLLIVTDVNGRKASGSIPTQTRSVAPRQRALLTTLSDAWRGDVKTWTMSVTVKTGRGEVYRNDLVWK
jgi:hypothetical protein